MTVMMSLTVYKDQAYKKYEHIVRLHKKHPDWSRFQLAKAANCTQGYVSKVLLRYGLVIRSEGAGVVPNVTMPTAASLSSEVSPAYASAVNEILDNVPYGMCKEVAFAWRAGFELGLEVQRREHGYYQDSGIKEARARGYDEEQCKAFAEGYEAASDSGVDMDDFIVEEGDTLSDTDDTWLAVQVGEELASEDHENNIRKRTPRHLRCIARLGLGYTNSTLVTSFTNTYLRTYDNFLQSCECDQGWGTTACARTAMLDEMVVRPTGMSIQDSHAWQEGYELQRAKARQAVGNPNAMDVMMTSSLIYKARQKQYNESATKAYVDGYRVSENLNIRFDDGTIPQNEEGVAGEGEELAEFDREKSSSKRTPDELQRIALLVRGYDPELVPVFIDSYCNAMN